MRNSILLWNLYEKELSCVLGIVQLPVTPGDRTLSLSEVLGAKPYQRMVQEWNRETDFQKKGAVVLHYLKACEHKEAAAEFVLSFTSACDLFFYILKDPQIIDSDLKQELKSSGLFLRLSCDSLTAKSQDLFYKLLKFFDLFAAFVEPFPFFLEPFLSPEFTSYLRSCGLNERLAKDRACAILFRELPYSNVDDWYWKFWKALDSSEQNGNKSLMKHCFPSFHEEYKQHLAEKELIQNSFEVVPIGQNLDTRLTVDLSESHLPVGVLKKVKNCGDCFAGIVDEGGSPKTLVLKRFQEELAESALNGANTIVCAPTGSGKTLVAVKVILEHLERVSRQGKEPMVAFLVPTLCLVSQQKDVLVKYLPEKWRVGFITGGDSEVPKNLMVQQSHVTVMTPQLLLNMLRARDRANRQEISKFSLLVLDECHHCDLKYPYNDIMTFYLDRKLGPQGFSDGFKPQILGLTASLGVGKGTDDMEEAQKYILTLMANMDAEYLSTVEKNTNDLAEFVNVPQDLVQRIAPMHECNPFSIHISDVMKKIEDAIRPYLERLIESKALEGVPAVMSDKRYSLPYNNWVCQLKNKIPELESISDALNHELVACLQHLEYYRTSLEINAHLPINQAFAYLEEIFKDLQPTKSEIDENLVKLYLHQSTLVPEVKKLDEVTRSSNLLVEKLVEILSEVDLNSRVIVFVRTRYLTGALKACLMGMPQFKEMNVETLTAVNASGEKGGQTEAEQERILSDFKSGKCRIIVATTVAEEGLDIPECNLVIKYNHVTNEIAMVQRRGRGRAIGSRSILLALEGFIAEKEMRNILREKLMHDAIQKIKKMGNDLVTKNVQCLQDTMYKDRMLQRELEAERKKKQQNLRKFKLQCRKCTQFLCESSAIRKVQHCHYVCVDGTIWPRCNAKPLRNREELKKRLFYDLAIPGKAFCAKCGTDLGNVIKFRSAYFPALKAEKFRLEEEVTGERSVSKKWKIIISKYFCPGEIERTEIVEMGNNPPDSKQAMEKLLQEAGAKEQETTFEVD